MKFLCTIGALVSILATTVTAQQHRPLRPCSIPPHPLVAPPAMWPGGIVYYEFDGNVTPPNQVLMRAAMDEWQFSGASVSFVPRTSEAAFIHIIDDPTTNSSTVGMTGTQQDVRIANWDFRFIMAHELCHALGFWHEQSRWDRDTFVAIQASNIQAGQGHNFDRHGSSDWVAANTAYDFDSVMHYSQCAFTSCFICMPSCETITVLPPNQGWQSLIGQRTHLSALDIQDMIDAYGPRGLCSPTQSIPATVTNWQSSVTIPRFDPNLGVLVGVQVTLSGTVVVAAAFENTDSAPQLVTLTLSGCVRVLRPGGASEIISVNPTRSFSESVTAFDGVLDFGGTSGRSYPLAVMTQLATASSPPPASDLALFTGPAGSPGTITLPVAANGKSNAAPGLNIASLFQTWASAGVTVCYLYHAAPRGFCFGDGTGTLCPCGNTGAPGNGCANSLNAYGANLTGTGLASIASDSFVLSGAGMPNSSALYFQGGTQVNGGAGAAFGDGLRCAAGSVIRLGTKTNASGASQYPAAGDPSVSARGLVNAPGTRTYQTWYRNVAAFCTPDTFNLTNGLSVTWGA